MELTTADATVIDRGRGPEIAGTRITVYDVMDYLKHDWHRDRIAALFRLSSRDIQAAIDYIDQHPGTASQLPLFSRGPSEGRPLPRSGRASIGNSSQASSERSA